MNNKNINIKEILYVILGILCICFVRKHPFLTLGLVLLGIALAIPVLTSIEHKQNLKTINSKVKKAINCEYCGSEIRPGTVNCPNCGAVIDVENSKDLVQAINNENINYTQQAKNSLSITKFIIFILFTPIIFIFILLILAVLNDGSYSVHLLN